MITNLRGVGRGARGKNKHGEICPPSQMSFMSGILAVARMFWQALRCFWSAVRLSQLRRGRVVKERASITGGDQLASSSHSIDYTRNTSSNACVSGYLLGRRILVTVYNS